MENRQEAIRQKGFYMYGEDNRVYNQMKNQKQKLIDVAINTNLLKQSQSTYDDKTTILRALTDGDAETLREISDYWYRTDGIYYRACNYFSNLYRYDWYVTTNIIDQKIKNDKVVKEFQEALRFLDRSSIKKVCGDIAAAVVRTGVYYGYRIESDEGVVLQELPAKYCRARYTTRNRPHIEFNMKFFDDSFSDAAYRMKVLQTFPKEFSVGYVMYKEGKLKAEYQGDGDGWFALSPDMGVKFSLGGKELPLFVNAIPAIIDLKAAQELDRRKQMQNLLKIIVQKLPRDKNGDLLFDIEEARDIHENAVVMLANAIGVDVLTTFTDVESIDLADKNTTATQDELSKNERTVFNNLGISQNLFNTDGNLSLEKSILTDEASVRSLLLQMEEFYNYVVDFKFNKNKKYYFTVQMLETTQYNYKELSKLYKEQAGMGFSKILPQIALGHSQSTVINSIYFENMVLDMPSIMIPPMNSANTSGADIMNKASSSSEGGRPAKAEDELSTKTIQNKESMS